VLYLPKDLPEPPEVASLESKCGVQVKRLPFRVTHLDVDVPVPTPGLLYLPNSYVVPGGRFNEMYGWDSYFILLGLLRDGRIDLARGMVENFFFEIEHYGGILNANRTYYFTRSQPPFLSSMIRAIYDADMAAGRRQEAAAWLARAYGFAKRDHALWTSDAHRAGNTGLARYYDSGKGPVPEMADDDTYYQNVIHWLLDHPEVHTNYLVTGWQTPNAAERAELAHISCDPGASETCARAHVGKYWLTSDFYKGDRAMRESGFDTSFRFGPYSGSTQYYAPVCLNSLLYKYERDLAWMAAKLGKPEEASHWDAVALQRRAAINKYLWDGQKGMYFDYEFSAPADSGSAAADGRQSDYAYLTTFYPLWAGAADAEQARKVEAHLDLFEKAGGLAMSTLDSGVQWDLPYGWAPVTWLAVAGLAGNGDEKDAVRVAEKFMATVRDNFACDGTIREKYNVVTRASEVAVTNGYRQNVIGFGWTNAVYLKMEDLVKNAGASSMDFASPPLPCETPAPGAQMPAAGIGF
jgi:alpha,alpha-trehalase